MEGERNNFSGTNNSTVKCEQQATPETSSIIQLRPPLADSGPCGVKLVPLGPKPSRSSFAETSAASAGGNWTSSLPLPASSGGAAAGPVAILQQSPPYRNIQLRPMPSSASAAVAGAAMRASFGRGATALLVPLGATPIRPGAVAGFHERPQAPGPCRFGMPIEFQSGPFASLLPLTSGATAAASNPSSSRSLMMPRHIKVEGSSVELASVRLPSNMQLQVRNAATYSPALPVIGSNSQQTQDRLPQLDRRAETVFLSTPAPKSGSVNGGAGASSAAAWAAKQQTPAVFTDWSAGAAERSSRQPALHGSSGAAAVTSAAAAFQRSSSTPALGLAAPALGLAASLARDAAAANGGVSVSPAAAAAAPVVWLAATSATSLPPGAGGIHVPGVRRSSLMEDLMLPLVAISKPRECGFGDRSTILTKSSGSSLLAASKIPASNQPGCDRSSMLQKQREPVAAMSAVVVEAAATVGVGHEDGTFIEVIDSAACSPMTLEQCRTESTATVTMPIDVRKHVIEGFAIEESGQPFPVVRSSLLTGEVLKRKRGGQAGRRSLPISIVAPPTEPSSRASSPAGDQSGMASSSVATPDSVLGIDGPSPFALPLDLPIPHTTARTASTGLAATSLLPKQPKAEPLGSIERSSSAAAAAATAASDHSTQQQPLLLGGAAAAAAATCSMCGQSGAQLRAFASKLFCSKSCSAAYRRTFNSDGTPVVKRKRGRPPGSGNRSSSKPAKQPRPVRTKAQRRLGSSTSEGVSITSRQRSAAEISGGIIDSASPEHAMDQSSSSNSLANSPSVADDYSADGAGLTRTQVLAWSVDDVYEFILTLEGCSPYAEDFRTEEIDGHALLLLSEDHLVNGLSMKLGPALKILSVISPLR